MSPNDDILFGGRFTLKVDVLRNDGWCSISHSRDRAYVGEREIFSDLQPKLQNLLDFFYLSSKLPSTAPLAGPTGNRGRGGGVPRHRSAFEALPAHLFYSLIC